jgi:Ca2+-binding EF-hand superfamily protein
LFDIGRIEFEEFAEIIADTYFKKFSRAEILEAFRRFDHNRDGFIEADELQNILGQLGRNFSNEEVCFNFEICLYTSVFRFAE